jgi:geranyl-CoA carboxylase alpha subunit
MAALAAALIAERGRYRASALLSHWHSSGLAASPLLLDSGGAKLAMNVAPLGERRYRVAWDGETHDVELLSIDGTKVRFLAGGLAETARFAWQDALLHLSLGGVAAAFEDVLLVGRGAATGAAAAAALAPMTGTIAAVRVKAGDVVRKGQCLVILEAMKMEHEIVAPRDGTVASVLVTAGEQVMTRKLLVEFVPAAA